MLSEKLTVTIPQDLKARLIKTKDELQTTMSAIYREALEAYLEKKEIERWEKGALLASKDKEYLEASNKLSNVNGEFSEY